MHSVIPLHSRVMIPHSVLGLLVSEQRSTLAVLIDNLSTGEQLITTNKTGKSDKGGQNKEETTDGESEDPLESGKVGKHLTDSGGYSALVCNPAYTSAQQKLSGSKTYRKTE